MTDTPPGSLFAGLFETHLHVADLGEARRFYEDILGLPVGFYDAERRAIFYWIAPNRSSMLGIWERPAWLAKQEALEPRVQHIAFEVGMKDLHQTIDYLRTRGLELSDFFGNVTEEPTVFAWIPAASIYFRDPDRNLLELVAKLPGPPRPEIGVVRLSEWRALSSRESS